MVDNRSAGFFGIGGSFNFKSGDISGTAAKTQDDKMGQGTEYFAQGEAEDEQSGYRAEPFVDRSAQLRATLNSLAMMNVANVLNVKKRKDILDEDSSNNTNDQGSNPEKEDLDEEFLDDLDDNGEAEEEYQ